MEKKGIDDLVIVRFLNGTATAEEAESVIQYLEEDGDNRLNYFTAKRIWLESNDKSKDEDLLDRDIVCVRACVIGPSPIRPIRGNCDL